MKKSRGAISVSIGVLAVLWSFTLSAATVTKISDEAFAPLRARSPLKRIVLDRLPIYDDHRSVIDLEEFQVWAPDSKILIYGEHGKLLKTAAPAPMHYFRGLVNGDRESFAYFSIDETGRDVEGLVVTRDRQFSIASQRRPFGAGAARTRDENHLDTFMTTYADNEVAAMMPDKGWQCAVDDQKVTAGAMKLHATGFKGMPVTSNGITGSQTYTVKVDILTDFELYQNAGSNTTTESNYIANLTGALATVYNRDLHTTVVLGNVSLFTSAGDPWAANDPNTGLAETGDYVHTHATSASNTVFLSGKPIGGGVAWEAVACGSEFFCTGGNCGAGFDNHYGGPYAWCGGIGNLFGSTGLGSIPDVSTAPYAMPSGTQNFWPLAEYAHELGHNLAGHHTQCVVITSGEFTAAGFTDGTQSMNTAANQFVDHCYGHDGGGCFSGTDYLSGSQGVFKGTIMSYCHNVSPGGTQSRYTFGQPAEPSHHELDDYMLNAAGPLAGGDNLVTGIGAFSMSLSGTSAVNANSTGNTATITAAGAVSYEWTITNGTITSTNVTRNGVVYGTTQTVTYTAGSSGSVVLRATAYGANRCGITDTKTVTINAACSYSLLTYSGSFSKSATNGAFVRVIAPNGCAWSAISNSGFLAITGGTPGSGTANIAYNVGANATGASRTGTMTVAGNTFTVTQNAESQFGDSSGDGKTDLVWRNSTTGQTSVWIMDGATPQAGSGLTNLQFSDNSYNVAAMGDFNGDGKADIVWRNSTTGDTIIWFMNGVNVTGGGYVATIASPWQVAGAGDFNGDGKADLLWRNGSTGVNSIWFMNGLSVLGGSGTINTISDLNWHVGGVGDFNGDGKADIVWRNDTTGTSSVWMMNGTSLLPASGTTFLQIGTAWRCAGVGDFNGDGLSDIIWRNTTTGENIVWLMNGLNTLAGSGFVQSVNDTNWAMVAFGDYNGDGAADIVWRNNTTGDTSIWLMSAGSVGAGSGVLGTIAAPWQVAGPR